MEQGREEQARELAAAVRCRSGFRYEAELRGRLTAFAQRGRAQRVSWTQLSDAVGVPAVTLQRWVEDAGQASVGEVVVVRAASSPMRSTPAGDGVALVSPDGWRIENLSVADAVALLRGLAGR